MLRRLGTPAQLRLLACAALAAALAAAPLAAQVAAPPADPSPSLAPSPGPSPVFFEPPRGSRYRFGPDGPWIDAAGPVTLAAFQGEARRYDIEIEEGAARRVVSLAVDRRPPKPPAIEPPPGFVGSSLAPRLSAEGVVFVSVDGAPFSPYDPKLGLRFSAPTDATRILSLVAYARDATGNLSRPSSATWILAPEGLKPSASPTPAEPAVAPSAAVTPRPEDEWRLTAAEDFAQGFAVEFSPPEGATALLAVSQDQEENLPHEAYAELASREGRAVALVPINQGDLRPYYIRAAYRAADGSVVLGPVLELRRSSSPVSRLRPEAPEPLIAALGSWSVVSWPASSVAVYVSLDGGQFEAYRAPLAIDRSAGDRSIRYYAELHGTRGELRELALPLVRLEAAPEVRGAIDGGMYGTAVELSSGQAGLRYELGVDGATPAPIGPASPRLGPSLKLEGAAGSVKRYFVRVAAVREDGSIGTERFLRFGIDLEPPPVPTLTGLADGPESEVAETLAFVQQEGRIFVSVDPDTPRYRLYEGPLSLGEGQQGRRSYLIRAYAEDEFGNRSAPMQPRRLVIDPDSVYVAEGGRVGAAGTMADPFGDLREALGRAEAVGRRTVYIRGRLALRGSLSLSPGFRLIGARGEAWEEGGASGAALSFDGEPGSDAAYLRIAGGSVELENLALRFSGGGTFAALRAQGAELRIRAVELIVSGGLDAQALSLVSSTLRAEGLTYRATASITARFAQLERSELVLADARLEASGVMLFEAFRARDSKLELASTRVDASPGQAFSGLALAGGSARLADSAFFVRAGAASFRLFSLEGASLQASGCYLELDWRGPALVASLSRDASLKLAYSSMILSAGDLSLVSSEASSYELVANILQVRTGRARFEAAASGAAPVASTPSLGRAVAYANALWGFTELGELNSRLPPGLMRNFEEAPALTFAAREKDFYRLAPSSACVRSAPSLDWAGERYSANPSIGAHQY